MEIPKCEMPGIPIDAENLEIIETPSLFYEKLLELTSKTERRLALSSLYLGEGELEKNLVKKIRERMEQIDIEVTILLDLLRGTRKSSEGESSVTVLKPIADKAKIFLYHTPELNGLVKRILPQRADEIIGLQHMKLYIFDDNVLISGANLSDSYFTDRTDRWFLFKNCKPLADFFHEIIMTVGDTSFIVKNDQVVPSSKCDIHPYLGGSQSYRDLLKLRVETVIEKYKESRKNQEKTESETWIYPVLQMGLLGIHQEFQLLNQIFAMKNSEMKMTMASGYFNFIRDYEDLILMEGDYRLDILTASPFANGFFESKGFSKYIPPLYSNISEQFLLKQQRNNRQNVQMYQYFREGWTFHAKGLWAEHHNQIMTLIGSSNYGYRSVHRDLEAQIMVVTKDPKLVERLREEKNRLFEYSSLLDMAALQQPEHHIPPIVRVISRLVRSFL
ncbi:CRE-PGS-1 protein [Caenorhabditis remanei]|uniref:CDP-diacylglycerol--glycerol-3-phosphate 3-phosphatidyltransferase n=1 Tax=Caenorhabditis remanei TaxID=31234 RepID=E3M3J9_CAERE|nr:CRE-PGS-1 protein [Caenorhabditis remanei]